MNWLAALVIMVVAWPIILFAPSPYYAAGGFLLAVAAFILWRGRK